MKRHVVVGFVGAGLLAIGGVAGFGVKALADGIPGPNALYYSGTLAEASGPVTGTRAITIYLWPDATSQGTPLCETVSTTTQLVDGHFRIPLSGDCKSAINANPNAYVEVVEGVTSLGRVAIGAVPYAVEADRASGAAGALAQQVVPSGAVMAFNLAACPPGWSPVTAAVGRVVVGAPNAAGVGATGGADSLALTTQQLPGHAHTITDPGHTHGSGQLGFITWGCTQTPGLGFGQGLNYSANTSCAMNMSGLVSEPWTDAATTGITATDVAGGGQPFDNRQASIAFLYCQKN